MAEGHACEISVCLLWKLLKLAQYADPFKARRNAMENASKNAGEMINKYVFLPHSSL